MSSSSKAAALIGIEAGGGFVQQQQPRIERQRPRQRGALDHAAGELRRILARRFVRQSDQPHLQQRQLIERVRRQLQVLEHRQLHVLQHRERGEQRALLEGDAVGGLDLLELALVDSCVRSRPSMQHLARLRPLQAEDGAQQHRLAGARAADDAEHLALLHGHVEMVVHHLRAEAVDQPAHFDEGFGHQMSSCQNATANSASANITRKMDCTTATVVRRPSSREESRTCRPR